MVASSLRGWDFILPGSMSHSIGVGNGRLDLSSADSTKKLLALLPVTSDPPAQVLRVYGEEFLEILKMSKTEDLARDLLL